MKTARVIVTRPEQGALHWVRQLQQTGIDAEAFPLIEIAPLAHAASPRALNDYSACLFVSAHAVEYFFQENTGFTQYPRAQVAINKVANHALGEIPPNFRFLAPGPGTAAALRSAGIAATQIDAPAPDAGQFDSKALWQEIGRAHV